MTAEEWDACPAPGPLIEALRRRGPDVDRWRLVHAGYCRLRWEHVPGGAVRSWVELAERAGREGSGVLGHVGRDPAAWRAYRRHHTPRSRALRSGLTSLAYLAIQPGFNALTSGWDTPSRRAIAALIRDVYGNPFRPVARDPAWLTPTAVGLAGAIYAGRAWDRLPVLADALEDAGCTNADVLAHLRGPGPHARGCWAVDLVLGK